ncbi:hypothetical protein [Nonomuraea sp. NPDC050202]|uniref:hypothetical protein n=1 Tax=Nonomuraea sp. NPDC050202 TaxID=3155035 RepID=UPI0033F23B94
MGLAASAAIVLTAGTDLRAHSSRGVGRAWLAAPHNHARISGGPTYDRAPHVAVLKLHVVSRGAQQVGHHGGDDDAAFPD